MLPGNRATYEQHVAVNIYVDGNKQHVEVEGNVSLYHGSEYQRSE